MAIKEWNDLQLRFDLPGLDEVEEDAAERFITPEEARLISEASASTFSSRNDKPEWFKDYLMLREQGWPWRVACYIAWASSPKIGRKPETIEKLATEVLGLKSSRVIYTWRKKYKKEMGIDSVVSMMQTAALWEHRRDVINALVEQASKADYKSFNDRKLFLELIGDFTPSSDLNVMATEVDLKKLSNAQIIQRMSDEQKKLIFGDEGEPDEHDASDKASDETNQ